MHRTAYRVSEVSGNCEVRTSPSITTSLDKPKVHLTERDQGFTDAFFGTRTSTCPPLSGKRVAPPPEKTGSEQFKGVLSRPDHASDDPLAMQVRESGRGVDNLHGDASLAG